MPFSDIETGWFEFLFYFLFFSWNVCLAFFEYAIFELECMLTKTLSNMCILFARALSLQLNACCFINDCRVEGLQPCLLAVTAGGFVYVSCVSVIPDILSSQSCLSQTLYETIGISMGVSLMILVAAYE